MEAEYPGIVDWSEISTQVAGNELELTRVNRSSSWSPTCAHPNRISREIFMLVDNERAHR
jgi:hypothetical protein